VYTYNTKVVSVLGYVAQLVPPPKNLALMERGAMSMVLHTATNAFRHADYFGLSVAGGPVLKSACAMTRATMFRTAVETLPQWQDWKVQLDEAAILSLPVSRVCNGFKFCEFWDGPPIALSLSESFRCFPGDAKWAPGAREAFQIVSEKRSAAVAVPDRAMPSRVKVQSIAYRCLMNSAFPNTLQGTVVRRMHKLGILDVSQHSVPEFDNACAIMRKLRKHDAMCVIKTWTNSWSTSYRYHEPILLPCLLGCQEGKDDLSHYVDCIQIQIILEDLILDPPSTPLERIGLQRVTRDLTLSCAAVFAAYHAIKRSHFITGLDGSPLTCEQGTAAQRIFAEAFQASADDAKLTCKSAARIVPFFDQI
jgi:hypothetical protein